MVTESKVKDILSKYAVTISYESRGESIFLTVRDKKSPLEVTMHFIKTRIYSVSFLNNEFFEMTDEDLLKVLLNILQGKYGVHTTVFKRRNSIKMQLDHKEVVPERVTSRHDYDDVYSLLPKAFSRIVK